MIIKKEIPDSEDWSTNTNNPMINGFRDIMKRLNENVGKPAVGIFWYDTNDDELFGVIDTTASTLPFYESDFFKSNAKTTDKLHYQVWQKEFNRGRDERFKAKYITVPRGRVFEVEDRGFVVCVGTWINDYPSAKDLIIDEFNLPNNTEFLVDSHWNTGHGWSDKKF